MTQKTTKKHHPPIFRTFLIGMAMSVVLSFVVAHFAHGPYGRPLAGAGYQILQHRLTVTAPGADTVVVINTAGLGEVKAPTIDNDADVALDRSSKGELASLIRTLFQMKDPPAAIGIDADLSPDQTSLLDGLRVTKDDDKFLQTCLAESKRNKVPIFLGVFRTQDWDPKQWLFEDRFKDMAGNIAIPAGNQWQMLDQTRFRDNEPLPSLSSRLATVFLGQPARETIPTTLRGFVSRFREESAGPKGMEQSHEDQGHATVTPGASHDGDTPGILRKRYFLADYGSAEGLIINRVEYQSVLDKNQKTLAKLKGKMVLLGNADPLNPPKDSFAITGKGRIPGVYLHACAVLSLINTRPLLQLTESGQFAVDMLLSLAFLSATALSTYVLSRRGKHDQHQRAESWVLAITALGALFVGVVIVDRTKILWIDFVPVLLGLVMLHRPASELGSRAFEFFPMLKRKSKAREKKARAVAKRVKVSITNEKNLAAVESEVVAATKPTTEEKS